MELLEYQAKSLFHQVGIPILPSQAIANPSQLKRLQIAYPVVLKSQVRTGGRGKAGGVKFVENTIDAIAAAHAIFSLPIGGEYPEVLLAETRYSSKEEFFLAVVLDYQLQKPTLLGSVKGGMDVETLLQNTQKVVIDEQFSPFHARKLAVKMGLKGVLLQSVSVILEKMYYLFESKDLDVIEINPLGIGADGQVMALDGKITINDHALSRHLDLLQLTASKDSQVNSPNFLTWLFQKPRKGNITVICNSFGLALNTWDLLIQRQGKPSSCLILNENNLDFPVLEQLKAGLEKMLLNPDNVILINILGSSALAQGVIQALSEQFSTLIKDSPRPQGDERMLRATRTAATTQKRTTNQSPYQAPVGLQPQIVLRLMDESDQTIYHGQLSPLTMIHWRESIEDAVKQAIALAKGEMTK